VSSSFVARAPKKVEYLEENRKRKEMEIQRLRVQAEENMDFKGCVKQTEEKLGEMEQTLKELKANSGKPEGLEIKRAKQ
jgi:hypothetical protein